jgi:hypothetical protein
MPVKATWEDAELVSTATVASTCNAVW